MKEIIYEPHPVTADRKKALIEKGYKIIDAIFAPEDYIHPDKKSEPTRKKPAQPADIQTE